MSQSVPTNHNVFLLFSAKPVKWLADFIEYHTAPEDRQYPPELKVVRGPGGRETARTIAVFPERTFETLREKGYCDKGVNSSVRVDRYELHSNNYPPEGHKTSLFVPVPTVIADDEVTVEKYLNSRLERVATWGVLPAGSWKLHVPVKSRSRGGVRGGCTVSFDCDVDPDAVVFTRLLLTDTTWEELGDFKLMCHWARDPNYFKSLESTDGVEVQAPASKVEQTSAVSDKKREKIQKLVRSVSTSVHDQEKPKSSKSTKRSDKEQSQSKPPRKPDQEKPRTSKKSTHVSTPLVDLDQPTLS